MHVNMLLTSLIPLLAILGQAATPRLSVDEVRRLQLVHDPDLILIDVRPPDAYMKGHIDTARNITVSEIDRISLPKDARIVVYCSEPACALSSSAAERFVGLGYSNTSVLDGGFDQWLKHHYPAQTGKDMPPSRAKSGMVSIEEARKEILDCQVQVLDVRSPIEFSAGHLPTARNVPLETIDSAISGLAKDRLIVVYDRQSSRSSHAAQTLSAAGFRVAELAGGLAGWVRKKYPLEVK